MTKTARSTLTNALSLVQHELSNSKIELARKELMECRDTIEYAIWSLDNAHAHEAGDVNKAVFRIWPEFFLVAGAGDRRKFLRQFGHWQLNESQNTLGPQDGQNYSLHRSDNPSAC